MSASTHWVPPRTDRFPQTIEAEVVVIPESKGAEGKTVEVKVVAVDAPKPQGAGGAAAAAKIESVESQPSRGVLVFTEADKVLLETQERVIEKYLGAFLLVGEALAIIKGRDLQRMLDPKLTFDEYCSKKWGFGEAYAYRLISGYECVKNLKDNLAPQGVTVFPTNEAQVRPLTSLPPKDQVKAWLQILKKADGNVTATLVFNIVKGASAKKSDKTSTTKPTSDAGASAEQKTLIKIAKLVADALRITPKKRTASKLSAVLVQIQGLLGEN
jgi:hypothetical protein